MDTSARVEVSTMPPLPPSSLQVRASRPSQSLLLPRALFTRDFSFAGRSGGAVGTTAVPQSSHDRRASLRTRLEQEKVKAQPLVSLSPSPPPASVSNLQRMRDKLQAQKSTKKLYKSRGKTCRFISDLCSQLSLLIQDGNNLHAQRHAAHLREA